MYCLIAQTKVRKAQLNVTGNCTLLVALLIYRVLRVELS